MGYRDYSTAKGLIVDATNHGDFTTISDALAVASSGQTIFIRPGTYTENPTLKAGVNLTGFTGDGSANSPNVTIIGKCTATFAGACTLSGIALQTNSDYLLAVTGSSATVVQIYGCTLNCSNNTGIEYTSSSSFSGIEMSETTILLGTIGIAIYTMSSPGGISIDTCIEFNAGATTTTSANSAGSVFLQYSQFNSPFSTSGTGSMHIAWCNIQTNTNTTCVAMGGSGANFIQYSNFVSGSASSIVINTTLSMFTSSVNSSYVNAIDGSGTINKAFLVFTGSSSNFAGALTVNTYTTA
jgi:hypothetical protein